MLIGLSYNLESILFRNNIVYLSYDCLDIFHTFFCFLISSIPIPTTA